MNMEYVDSFFSKTLQNPDSSYLPTLVRKQPGERIRGLRVLGNRGTKEVMTRLISYLL